MASRNARPLLPERFLTCLGPSLEWINKLKSFWQDKYSWPDAQKQISEWHHFTTEIESLKVHFIHEKARKRQKEAIPLLLVHGWPGTFFEYEDIRPGKKKG
jgi:Epoxide hydrolase N terminus